MTAIAIEFVALLGLIAWVQADIVFENQPIVQTEVFDLKYALPSDVPGTIQNATKYYCVYRNMWTNATAPVDYPKMARISTQVIFSHTKQYTPFLKDRDANRGVEVLVEEGVTETMQGQLTTAGDMVLSYGEGKAFFVNKQYNNLNFQYLPPINVDAGHPFLSGLAAFDPSPDWFTGFYMMNTIDEYARTYWSRFKIQTYPWDAGTDGGTTYTALDDELEDPEYVERMTVATAPNKVFVSPLGDEILPTAEWECVLHTCSLYEPDCVKPDFPPANGCDILKYPACNSECDPKVDNPCQRCKRESKDEPSEVWYTDCCEAGKRPRDGSGCAGVPDSGGMEGVAGLLSAALLSVAVVALY